MKLDIPKTVAVPLGVNARGEQVTREMKYSDFVAEWVLPLIGGKGIQIVTRNQKLYRDACAADTTGVHHLADGLYLEIRKALNDTDINGAAFRLAPFFELFADKEEEVSA